MGINASILGLATSPADALANICAFEEVAALYSSDEPSSVALSGEVSTGMNLDRLLVEFDCEALQFLREPISVLEPSAIPAAIAALEQLFARIAAEPARALACSYWEGTEV